jgi:hypothetical protein
MEPVGPEASLVSAKIDPRVQLAEFARWEYPREEVRAVEERARTELVELEAERSATRAMLARAGEVPPRDERQLAARGAAAPEADGLVLLAMRVIWAEQRGGEAGLPISAIPIAGSRPRL